MTTIVTQHDETCELDIRARPGQNHAIISPQANYRSSLNPLDQDTSADNLHCSFGTRPSEQPLKRPYFHCLHDRTSNTTHSSTPITKMKLIVSGATGFVATEVLRQSLAHPSITQVIALSRREVQLGPNVDRSKFKQVLLKDYCEYPEEVLKELRGADACIWSVCLAVDLG
jgi:hypothetical protein